MKLSDFPKHVQEKIKRDNPSAFGVLGAVETNQPKPALSPALGSGHAEQSGGEKRIAVRVIFIASLFRPIDHDNLVAAFKWLRDGVAEQLGVDDADERLNFDYHQIKAYRKADEGVIVDIKLVEELLAA